LLEVEDNEVDSAMMMVMISPTRQAFGSDVRESSREPAASQSDCAASGPAKAINKQVRERFMMG
jgi:hypothetical protein